MSIYTRIKQVVGNSHVEFVPADTRRVDLFSVSSLRYDSICCARVYSGGRIEPFIACARIGEFVEVVLVPG